MKFAYSAISANTQCFYQNELIKHGGYRRVRDLLSAKKVVDTLPEELREKITKPSQTRPLLRLVKTPNKLQEVVAIASQNFDKDTTIVKKNLINYSY
ncbi:MAG: hypothetical protein RM338_13935 [Nostoc sp. DedQUE12a]|nr:hypothetical protein [Nostoc sp. DedQUE12a]